MSYKISLILIFLFFASAESVGQSIKPSVELIAQTNSKSNLTQVVDLDLTVSSSGEIKLYVADFYLTHVLVIDRKGEKLNVVNRLGRDGQGPGEFYEVSDLQLVTPDLLMVFDGILSRISFFNTINNKLQKTINLNKRKRIHYPTELVKFGENDSLIYALSEQLFSDDADYNNQRSKLFQSFSDKGNAVRDSILLMQVDDAFILFTNESMSVNPSPEWGNKSLVRFYNDRIYYVWTEKPIIKLYDKEGNLLRSFKLELTELPITDEDKKRTLELESLIMDKRKSLLRKDLYKIIPENWPLIYDFIVDNLGRFWIALPSHLQNENRDWLILDSQGKVKGKVKLPLDFKIHQIRNDYIVGELFNFKNFSSTIQLYQYQE